MSATRPVIFGCSGLALTDEEKRFFADVRPCGFIVFSRNVADPAQLTALIRELRDVAGNVPALIDQEGGRVARLRPPHWPDSPPAARFRFANFPSEEKAREAAFAEGKRTGAMLATLGVNVDCAPVCDLECDGADAIIGDRSFGTAPREAITLAKAYADGLTASGVMPVIKHIPGHGRARCDSHKALPIVATPLEELEETDFAVFAALAHFPCAMTAHIVYNALDETRCATLSPAVISYIREKMGFDGLLMSDDVGMNALSGDFEARAKECIAAGCDVALHCSGDMREMRAVSAGLPHASGARVERWLRRFHENKYIG
ncbi:MAG: beta-N-acetylhexosaminidase [Rickettsiales bacterium]